MRKTCKNHGVSFLAFFWILHLKIEKIRFPRFQHKQVITEHWRAADKDHDPTLQSEARGRRWTLSKNETWSAGCQSRLYLCEDSNCLIALLASIIWNFGNFCCIDMTPVLNKGNGVHQSVDRIHDLVTLGNKKGCGIYLRDAARVYVYFWTLLCSFILIHLYSILHSINS